MAKRSALAVLVILALVAVALTACGGASEAAEAPLASPTPAATLPAANPTPSPTATTQVSAAPPAAVSAQAPDTGDDLFSLGERIFESEAGEGVGCSACHGADGKGQIGPDIRGKTPDDIRGALGWVDAMGFLRLGKGKIEAVSAYLQWLATQP
jgi:mono/diheme cytochrome c family protein